MNNEACNDVRSGREGTWDGYTFGYQAVSKTWVSANGRVVLHVVEVRFWIYSRLKMPVFKLTVLAR